MFVFRILIDLGMRARVSPGTLPLHFGGIPILTPQSYSTTMFKSTAGLEKTRGLPDTILIRRPKLEALLYRLLIGSSAKCIQTIQGTVTGLVPSDDMSTIQTVNVRTTEGEEKDMKNVSLVIGQSRYDTSRITRLNYSFRLHRRRPKRYQVVEVGRLYTLLH